MAAYGSLNRAAQHAYYESLAKAKTCVILHPPDYDPFQSPQSDVSPDAPTCNLEANKAAAAAPKANPIARLESDSWGTENGDRETTKPEGHCHAGSSRHPMELGWVAHGRPKAH